MTRTDNNNGPLSLDSQIDEDRVRRALGLKSNGATHQQRPEQARQRHRFVADGAVPVVMLNRTDVETAGMRERVTQVEAMLENERAAHTATKRTLHDLQAAHHALQTRLQHSEMAHADALKAERDARRAAEEALLEARRELLETPRRTRRVIEDAAELLDASDPAAAATSAVPARRGRKPRANAIVKEAKPVRWWTPSFRAKKG